MIYEYLCTHCNIKETTPSIICECGKEALKNFSAQVGKKSKPEYFENLYFDLIPGQSRRNTWHIPSDKINQPRNKG